jgi:hypothetical protein
LNAAFMSFQPHESGIHALRSVAGEASVTKARFRCTPKPTAQARADHDQHKLTRNTLWMVLP